MLLKFVFFLALLAIGYVEGEKKVPKVFWPGNSPSGRFNSHDGKSSPDERQIDIVECVDGGIEYVLAAMQIQEIRSPNYPFRYPANHVCSATFRAPVGYRIRATCSVIYLKKDDTLTFFDNIASSNVITYNGDKLMDQFIDFSSTTAQITFTTQDCIPGSGSNVVTTRKDKGFSCLVEAILNAP